MAKKHWKIIFDTDRLIIREFEPEDLEMVFEYGKQEVVFRYQNWGPVSKENILDFIKNSRDEANHDNRLNYDLCIVKKEDFHVIGECGFHEIKTKGESIRSEAKIGYMINPKYWNQGFATEVTQGLIKYGKNQLNLDLLIATCDSTNMASRKVLTKNGFELTEEKENHFMQKGKMRDTCVFNLHLKF